MISTLLVEVCILYLLIPKDVIKIHITMRVYGVQFLAFKLSTSFLNLNKMKHCHCQHNYCRG